ncbi:MAG: BMC domain-containing protein [Elusimicrobiota bacterium]|jgi:microcompartment protein CcmL/EutN|nr:BMC domain-containing protein [Elusimicrobiota bacterium]
MKKALGLIEFKTVPIAVFAVDAMLKEGRVELIFSAPTCPGKYIAMVSGEVADVESAIKRGVGAGEAFVIDSYIIPNISEYVFPALTGTVNSPEIEALGLIETITAVSAVMVGDIVVKASNIRLLELRLARGLGGKGEVFYTGELGDVEAATKNALELMGKDGVIVSTAVIPRPTKSLIEAIS